MKRFSNITKMHFLSKMKFRPYLYTFKEGKRTKKLRLSYKIPAISAMTTLGITFVLFILVFVVTPIVFMQSIAMQTFCMFLNVDDPKSPDFHNPGKYGIDDVENSYVTVQDVNSNKSLLIGVWEILPKGHQEKYATIMYFHGVACNRIKPLPTYNVLRQFFRVIAIDYRDFGDSSNEVLSEKSVVNDIVQIYKWFKRKIGQDFYIWGHSLGSALGTHTVKALRNEKIVPLGLVLESPFSTMREEVPNNPVGKIFSWLAYFEATILDPLEENGFLFNTVSNILNVDCPIMIMHAEDDNIIPFHLGRKLYETAEQHRKPHQGRVIYYQFPAKLGYKHLDITRDPNIPDYIQEFIGVCEEFNSTIK